MLKRKRRQQRWAVEEAAKGGEREAEELVNGVKIKSSDTRT